MVCMQSGNNCWTAVLHIIVVNPLGPLCHTCPFLCPEKVGGLGVLLLLQMQEKHGESAA